MPNSDEADSSVFFLAKAGTSIFSSSLLDFWSSSESSDALFCMYVWSSISVRYSHVLAAVIIRQTNSLLLSFSCRVLSFSRRGRIVIYECEREIHINDWCMSFFHQLKNYLESLWFETCCKGVTSWTSWPPRLGFVYGSTLNHHSCITGPRKGLAELKTSARKFHLSIYLNLAWT